MPSEFAAALLEAPAAEPSTRPVRYRLESDARVATAERRRLERELALSVRTGAFMLHYQPRVLLQGPAGRTAGGSADVGAEALIRWPHRKRGLIPPSAFIPLAERSGLMTDIGGWVLRTACAEATAWRDMAVVSVNISGRQLSDGALLAQLATALEESALQPEQLEVEFTESLLLDVDPDMLLTLSAVRDLGVGVTLDDFGTGFASLSTLKRLPLTAMKLDRSLVRDLPVDAEDAAIVRAVIATAHALGLRVVAEGIETESQRAFLTGCGCDEGQGYLFSRPVPAEQIRVRLGC